MSKAWMPLYIGDFLADTMHLNCQETGAYIRLLMHAWQHNGLVPDDNELLTRIVRCHPPHWPRLRNIMLPFFDLTKTPGSWYSKRVALELIKSDEISNKRKAAALQKHNKSSANVVHLHTQSQSQSPRKKKKDSCSSEDERFLEFWNGYLKKVGKKAALAAYQRALKETTHEKIMAALERQKSTWRDPKFIPHPATWLNQGRWDDEPSQTRSLFSDPRQGII